MSSEHSPRQKSTRNTPDTKVRARIEPVPGSIASRDDVQFYLVTTEGPKKGRWIQLGETPLVVGRDSHLDIALAGKDISRRHLLVSVVDGAVVVEDLGSTNGTFIDGQGVTTRAALPVGRACSASVITPSAARDVAAATCC